MSCQNRINICYAIFCVVLTPAASHQPTDIQLFVIRSAGMCDAFVACLWPSFGIWEEWQVSYRKRWITVFWWAVWYNHVESLSAQQFEFSISQRPAISQTPQSKLVIVFYTIEFKPSDMKTFEYISDLIILSSSSGIHKLCSPSLS